MTLKQKKLKRELRKIPKAYKWLVFGLSALLVILIGVSVFFSIFYYKHSLPQTASLGVDLSNLDYQEALNKIQKEEFPDITLILSFDNTMIASTSSELKIDYDWENTLTKEWQRRKELSWIEIIKELIDNQPKKLNPLIKMDGEQINNMIKELAILIDTPSKEPEIILQKTGQKESLKTLQGDDGKKVDVKKTVNKIIKSWEEINIADLKTNDEIKITAEVIIDEQKLDDSELEIWQKQAKALVGQKIILQTDKIDNFQKFISDQDLISWLKNSSTIKQEMIASMSAELAYEINRKPIEPKLTYDKNQGIITDFIPPKDGLELNQEKLTMEVMKIFECWLKPWSQEKKNNLTTDSISSPLQFDIDENQLLVEENKIKIVKEEKNNKNTNEEKEINLPECDTTIELDLITTQPQISLAETNNLGIQKEIGFGESYYNHSSAGRLHNVALAGKRLNLALVAPGEEFSFNKTLGDVSAESGYKDGWIIQGGRSVLSPGGGVCQVSSTLFRALLDSGVEITRRLPHAYRVSYYELNNDPGFDATVYSGNVDLRFKNDTPGHILIYVETNTPARYMTIRMFGTDDGRTTEIVDYKKYGHVAPPPTQYIEDPNLPAGTMEKIDSAVSGLKVSYTNVIKNSKGEEIRRDEYFSAYQAWSTKYLVGTKI